MSRRILAAHFLEGGSAGLVLGAAIAALGRYGGWPAASVTVIAALVAALVATSWLIARRHYRTARVAAAAIESALPESRNVVVTAEELIRHPDRARPWIRARVLGDAERLIADVEPRTIVPLRLRMASCLLAAAVAAGALNVHRRATGPVLPTIQETGGASTVDRTLTIVVMLQPPAYTNLPSTTLLQPDRLSVIEGTRVRVTIRASGPGRQLRFGTAVLPTRLEAGATVADLTLRESGYLAIDGGPEPGLIPVAVTPDRVPAVRIEKPARDLLLPGAAHAVLVEASATDDISIEELALRYTKVSGSGEQFEFVEGELPLVIVRHDPRSWRGRGEFALARLGLAPGDSLVYRVVARDGRPGDSGLATSDTFFIEVAGPGQAALEGFEMPPDRDRYALSQQMIVLKIQRLREREQTLAREALREQTGAIAAEQRAVRANFVFLMGGHVEDEEEEAERSNEIQEGRLEDTARREISRAISYMNHAEQGLVAIDTTVALQQAKLAVDALQRAFGRNRYFLRTLPVRSRIDPTRRLTGKLDDATRWQRKLAAPAGDARVQAVRDLLAELVSLSDQVTVRPETTNADLITRLSEQALAIDPVDAEWQRISSRLASLRDAMVTGERDAVNRRLREALEAVVAQARRFSTPHGAGPAALGPLRGAWAEELRR